MKQGKQSFRAAQRLYVAQRRAKIGELYLSGKTQSDIAQELDISTFTVSTDIGALKADWKQQACIDTAAHVAKLLAGYEDALRMALEAYEKSKQPRRITGVSKKEGADGVVTTTSATEVERPEGDPRFLALAIKARDSIVKLLNLSSMSENEKDGSNGEHPRTISEWVAGIHKKREEKEEARRSRVSHMKTKMGRLRNGSNGSNPRLP